MNDWNDETQRDQAFTLVLNEAMAKPKVKADLLDEKTAKTTLESLGSISLPPNMTVRFVRQEDKPDRLVMQIPAAQPIPFEPIAKPGFKTCYLGLWITYSSQFQEFQRLLKLARQFEMKDL